MKKFVYGLLALTACGKPSTNPANLLSYNDFDSIQGWSCEVDNPSLTQEQAHSGRYSVKAGPGIDYSLGYKGALTKLVPTRIAKLQLHAWVYVPNDKGTAVLVTEVKNPGQEKSVVWDGANLAELAGHDGFGHWIEVNREVALPAEANYDSELRVYLWRNTSNETVYLDDIQLLKGD